MKPIKNTKKYVPRYIMIWEAQLFGIATHRDLQLLNWWIAIGNFHFKSPNDHGTKAARHEVPWPKECIKSRSALRYLENTAVKIRWIFCWNRQCYLPSEKCSGCVAIRSHLKSHNSYGLMDCATNSNPISIQFYPFFLISSVLIWTCSSC